MIKAYRVAATLEVLAVGLAAHASAQGAAGPAISVGPTGGSITAADGRLSLRIPSGALDAATLVSIEPMGIRRRAGRPAKPTHSDPGSWGAAVPGL